MAERANFLTNQTAQTSKKVQNVRASSKNIADYWPHVIITFKGDGSIKHHQHFEETQKLSG